jgi:thiol-disulfide isomerase/thioredoxin
MKTKLKCIAVLLLALLAACSPDQTKNETRFSLNGRLTGQDTGIIVLRYVPGSTWQFDTAIISKERFRFQGEISEPTRATLINGKQQADLYIEPGKIKITLDKDKFTDFKLSGSRTQAEEDLINKMVKPVYEKLDLWKKKRSLVSDSIKNMKDEIRKEQLESELEDIDTQWFIARKELDRTWLKFVLENPHSYVSPYYLSILVGNDAFPLDSMILVFNGLDTTIQNSKLGNLIRVDLAKKENTRIGSLAPDFKAYDINKEIVTLSEFKGKSIVLLDIWASWCVPCRQSIPYLKTLYKTYHSKGFEIISVSIDMKKDAWLQAVKEEGIDIWHNIPVAENYAAGPSFYTRDDVCYNYDIGSVPTYLLVDKTGRITGTWKGLSEENEKTMTDQIAELLKE